MWFYFCLLKVSLTHAAFIVALALLLSSRMDVAARPTDTWLLSVYESKDASSQTVQAAEETSLTQIQGEREVKDTSKEIAQARKEHSVMRNQEETADAGGFIRTRFTRNIKNRCIKRYDYKIIYNHFFAIPICKKHRGCKEVIKFVNFGSGKTIPITYNCVRSSTWRLLLQS